MAKAAIDPIQDGLGNTGYRVHRVLPTLASAQVAAFVLDEVDPADLEPPVTPPEPELVVYPPNCDGLSVGEALTLIHEERDEH